MALVDAAFDPSTLRELDERFASTTAWVRHDASFYRCWIAETDDALPQAVRQGLRDQVATTLGLDLAGPVRITTQRMEVGDGADRHTDRPLVGYEAARLIVQLDTSVGGTFRMLEPSNDGWRPWLTQRATRNQGAAFELCEASHHEVTECRSARRTLVVHFWHRANPPRARPLVQSWLERMSFRDLPAALDPLLAEADATVDDSSTGFAGRVAWLLGKQEYADLIGAFQRALVRAPPASEAEARARFVVDLALESFDRYAFEALPHRSQRWWLDALAEPDRT